MSGRYISDTDFYLWDVIGEAIDVGHLDIAQRMIDNAGPEFAFALACHRMIEFLRFRGTTGGTTV